MLIKNPSLVSNAFFNTVSGALFWFIFVLSIAATVIASQAMISAAFTIIQQVYNYKIILI